MIKLLINISKIFFINVFIILIFIFSTEMIFGYWFDEDNFGPFMREHRMKNQRIEWNDGEEKKIYFYRRNYHGFRGEDIEPAKIQAVIFGGSVIDERYKPDDYTITGFLNKKLKENKITLKITNGAVEARSTGGLIYAFENWLFKIKDFSPKYLLFYVGVNDTLDLIKEAGHDGHTLNPEKKEIFFDTIKSRSILYDSIRIFKFKYLPRKGFVKYDGKKSKKYQKEFSFISYEFAKNNYNLEELEKKYNTKIKNYMLRIEKLSKLSKKINSIPVFITNLGSSGHTELLFTLNENLIKYCEIKKLICINLAKKVDGKVGYWYDNAHTTKQGSQYISELIFESLGPIIKEKN